MFEFDDRLIIPEGINFECTGCGNCCFQWPVPSTATDRQRIIDLAHELEIRGISGDPPGQSVQGASDYARQSETVDQMPATSSGGSKLTTFLPAQIFSRVNVSSLPDNKRKFDYLMEKRADGKCLFLTQDNRCLLHLEFGAEAKPSMCQLFPYTFTEAPDGFYASVSFASTGTLLNRGRPLTEQREWLLNRLALFKRMFPDLSLDWSQAQLVDGSPLSWHDYLRIERKIIKTLNGVPAHQSISAQDLAESGSSTDSEGKKRPLDSHISSIAAESRPPEESSIIHRLSDISRYLYSLVPSSIDLDREGLVSCDSEQVDKALLHYMIDLYFPFDPHVSSIEPPSVKALLEQMSRNEPLPAVPAHKMQPETLQESLKQCDFKVLAATGLGALPPQSEDLLRRFIYLRLFSKLFFGPGFAHFSLIAGFHHLGLLVAIVRMLAKLDYQAKGASLGPEEEFIALCESVRTLERRLTSIRHTRESATILQVLLESPRRFQRLLYLAA